MKSVLIADDELHLRFVLKEILASGNYNLYEACDGEEALRLSIEIKPDIIVLDVAMPKLTGYEVVKKLIERNIKSKIIMLSAKAQKSDIKKGLELGVYHYMIKPFDLSEFSDIINKATLDMERH